MDNAAEFKVYLRRVFERAVETETLRTSYKYTGRFGSDWLLSGLDAFPSQVLGRGGHEKFCQLCLDVCDILPTLTLRVQRGLPNLAVRYSCPTPLI